LKIEFLDSGSSFCPLIRLFGKDDAIYKLRDEIQKLSGGGLSQVCLQDIPGFTSINIVRLCASVGVNDCGVITGVESGCFEWVLSRESWRIVEELIESLINSKSHPCHQWLAGGDARWGLEVSNIGLVISTSNFGEW
jgi:hypothetical protein